MRRRFTRMHRSLLLLAVGLTLLVTIIAIASIPHSAPDWRAEARGHLEAGRYTAAILALDRALTQIPIEFHGPELDERRAQLLAERGACNLDLGRPEHALDDLRESRALQPGNPHTWTRESGAYLELGRYHEAADLLGEASLAFPERELLFRHAAAAALFARYGALLSEATAALVELVPKNARGELALALRRLAANDPASLDLTTIEERLLPQPHTTPQRRRAAQKLLEARQSFASADQLLADYEYASDLDAKVGAVRTEMHFLAGRMYEGKRLAEVLLTLRRADPVIEARLRTLLCNTLHELGLYENAAIEFSTLQRVHQRSGEPREARRAQFFALEEYLRARNGSAALDLLNRLNLRFEAGAPLNHFYLGYSRFLAGMENTFQRPIEQAVALFQRSGFPSHWFRNDEHRLLVYEGLLECIRFLARPELEVEVLASAVLAFPSRIDWARQRAALLRDMSRAKQEDLLLQDRMVLERAPRENADLQDWERDSLRVWKSDAQRATEVQRHARQIVVSYARRTAERDGPGSGFIDIYRDRKRRRKNERSAAEILVIQRAGSSLLGALRTEPALALSVYRVLIAEGHRDQGFLLMHGLADYHGEIPHFRFLLGRHELADGRLGDAADRFRKLFEDDQRDFEAGFYAWMLYRRLHEVPAARAIEKAFLTEDPHGTGKLIAMLAAREDGYPGVTTRIGRGLSSGGPWTTSQRGVFAQALLEIGQSEEAHELARQLLKRDPSNPFVVGSVLLSVASSSAGGDEARVIRYLQGQEREFAQLSVEHLWRLGELLVDQQSFLVAVRVFRMGLQKHPGHVPLQLGLSDALLALDRTSEAEDVLDQLEFERPERREVYRRALLKWFGSGTEATYEFLRERSADLVSGGALSRWIGLSGASLGRVSTALRALDEPGELDLDVARFATVVVETVAPHLKNTELPKAVRVLREQLAPGAPADARDRELDRWLSLALQPQGLEKLGRALVPVLALRAVPELSALLPEMRRRALESLPELGGLAREQATWLYTHGHQEKAVEVLLRQLAEDRGDVKSLSLLTIWSDGLTLLQVNQLLRENNRLGEGAWVSSFLQALRYAATGAVARALRILQGAQKQMHDPSPALVLGLKIRQREVLHAMAEPLHRGPYSNFGHGNRLSILWQRFDQQVEQVAKAHPNDPGVLAFVAAHLERRSRFKSPRGPLLKLLSSNLMSQPSRSWTGYRLVASVLVEEDGTHASLETLVSALRTSIENAAEQGVPLAGLEALSFLAEGLRRQGATDSAESLLELVTAHCPYLSTAAVIRARIADQQERPRKASKLILQAVVFGEQQPEVLCRLAEDALREDRDLERAAAAAGAALQSPTGTATPAAEARALTVRAQVAFLRDDHDASLKALDLANRALGEDPQLDIDLALQAYATNNRFRANRALSRQAEDPSLPQHALARRLLLSLQGPLAGKEEAEASEPGDPTTP